MILSFRNADIYFSALDGLKTQKEVVKEKFAQDIKIIKKPSSPNILAIALFETELDNELISYIIDNLRLINASISKVVFVGADFGSRNRMKRILKASELSFVYNFINDYEKAKIWLVS